MRVAFDTQVWVRALLAKDPNSIGSTLLRAARARYFECVGSKELLEELDETLSVPRIASKLTAEQAIEARRLVAALVQPLIELSGETMGCEDPEDDHILELAVKGKAQFLVTRDSLILSLKSDARKRLDDSQVTVFRDDVFCGFVRERYPTSDPAVKPVVLALVVEMTQAWLAKSEAERRAWLNDKLALMNEYMMWPNGIFANNVIESNHVLLFWNVTNSESADGLRALLQSDDVREYFDVKWARGGEHALTQEDVWRPFLT